VQFTRHFRMTAYSFICHHLWYPTYAMRQTVDLSAYPDLVVVYLSR
jgi:hypothetical protein